MKIKINRKVRTKPQSVVKLSNTVPDLAKGLRKHFDIRNPNAYFDKTLSLLTRTVTLDILALDDWLHEQHGNYEDNGKSMNNIIEEKYGTAAIAFVNQYM